MKPISRHARQSSSWLSGDLNVNFGSHLTVGKIKGSVRQLGQAYSDASVVIYNKSTLLPLAIKKPDTNGNYEFPGLNKGLSIFIVGFDGQQHFNAIIQDNVVPK